MDLFTKTFCKEEIKSVIGKRGRNFWILFAVFVFSIGAVEFSRSGLAYLRHEMSNPFINWIEIDNQSFSESFRADIFEQQANMGISDIEENYYILDYIYSTEFRSIRVFGRTIAYDSKLLPTLLDEKKNGAVFNRSIFTSDDFGFIVTKELLSDLGYEDDVYPLFLNYTLPAGDTLKMKEWGIETRDNEYLIVPIPILAVVDKLPNNMPIMAPRSFVLQKEGFSRPFDLSQHESYFSNIVFVSENDDLEQQIETLVGEYGQVVKEDFNDALRPAYKYTIYVDESIQERMSLMYKIQSAVPNLYRYYDYNLGDTPSLKTDYLSLMFSDLSKVSSFADYARKNYGVKIDMTTIDDKNRIEIFNALIVILCIAILFLSLVFLSIFLAFLIDSHFKSISKNLGTLMAFGLSNKQIVRNYLIVFMGLIFLALFTAVVVLLSVENVMQLLDFVRKDGFPYISISDWWVFGMLVGIPTVSAVVVCLSVGYKLKATPGDLIFERE